MAPRSYVAVAPAGSGSCDPAEAGLVPLLSSVSRWTSAPETVYWSTVWSVGKFSSSGTERKSTVSLGGGRHHSYSHERQHTPPYFRSAPTRHRGPMASWPARRWPRDNRAARRRSLVAARVGKQTPPGGHPQRGAVPAERRGGPPAGLNRALKGRPPARSVCSGSTAAAAVR